MNEHHSPPKKGGHKSASSLPVRFTSCSAFWVHAMEYWRWATHRVASAKYAALHCKSAVPDGTEARPERVQLYPFPSSATPHAWCALCCDVAKQYLSIPTAAG
jgi:hypothetical protein